VTDQTRLESIQLNLARIVSGHGHHCLVIRHMNSSSHGFEPLGKHRHAKNVEHDTKGPNF